MTDKIEAIKTACLEEIEIWETDAPVTDGTEKICEGRAEFAHQILRLLKRIEKDSKNDEKVRTIEEMSSSLRWPILSFASTDMAFRDNILVAGSYHGFNIYELNDNGIPNLVSSVVCPGGQGDVSIVENLLIMSVEENRSRIDCGLEGVNRDSSPDRFRGIRIFDISDLNKPKQVGAVQTCRGSHTHSVCLLYTSPSPRDRG